MIEHIETIRPADFQRILDAHARVVLAGAVRSGKSLLLDGVKPGRGVLRTDEVRGRVDWEKLPEFLVVRLRDVPRFVLAGMLAPHALAAGLEVDVVVWIERSRGPEGGPSDGLRAMVENWEAEAPAGRTLVLAERALREGEP